MMWRTFSALAILSLVSPYNASATELNSKNFQQSDQSKITQVISYRGIGRQGNVMKQFLEKSDLTEEQSTKIRAISQRHRAANEPNYQELQQAQKEMRSLLANNANPNQLRQKHLVIQSLSQKVGNNYFEAILEIRQILTPEQMRELADMMAQYQH